MIERLSLAAIIVAASSTLSIADDSYQPYNLEESREFRQQWTIDNWDEGGPLMRYVFLNMPEFWSHSLINRGGNVRELPVSLREDVAGFVTTTEKGRLSLSAYVAASTVNGALVLHRGEIVFEAYPRMRQDDKHLHMSVSKAFTSSLVAVLEDREKIDVAKPVDSYLPGLAGSGWEGVSVLDVLDMASGIGCLEMEEGAYDNPDVCYYHYRGSAGFGSGQLRERWTVPTTTWHRSNRIVPPGRPSSTPPPTPSSWHGWSKK